MPSWKKVITSGSSAQLNSLQIDGKNLDTTGVARDQVLKFNGTHFVPADYNATFVFSIYTFDDGISTWQLIGESGETWKDVDEITFIATYKNGPPTTAEIREVETDTVVDDWSNPFSTDGNAVAVTYPSMAGNDDKRRFKLTADGGDGNLTMHDSYIYFKNYVYYGADTEDDDDNYDGDFIGGFSTILTENHYTNDNKYINATGNKYIFWIYADRLAIGNVYFSWGTSTSNQVIMDRQMMGDDYSVTNSAGKEEDYKLWRSTDTVNEAGYLDVKITLPNNYIYWGSTGHSGIPTSGWDSDDILNLQFKESTNDEDQVWDEITGMTSDYILWCVPSRYSANPTFWDNSTGFGADFEDPVTVSVTNQYDYTEDYDVYVSSDTSTGAFTLETK